MVTAEIMVRTIIFRPRIGSFGFNGFCFMMFFSAGSSPRGITIEVSVTKFTQSICTASSGSLVPTKSAPIMVRISPALVLSR